MASKAHERGKAAGDKQGCGVAGAAHWAEYMASVSNEPTHDWIAEMADYQRGFAAGVSEWKAEHPYSVLGFGSHPDSGNDDCHTSEDFATLEAARAAYLAVPEPGVAFVMLDGPDVNEVRSNPRNRAPRRSNDSEWRREFAMQAGMAFGCDGYNDAMGY